MRSVQSPITGIEVKCGDYSSCTLATRVEFTLSKKPSNKKRKTSPATKRKQGQKVTPAGPKKPTGGHSKIIIGGVVVAFLAGGAWWQMSTSRFGASAAFSAVVPADLAEIEPQVRAYLEPFIRKVEATPRDAEAHSVLGQVYEANSFWPEAAECYSRALQLDPASYLARYHRAIPLRKMDEHEQAATELRDVTLAHPEFAPALHRLGDYLLDVGELDEAVSLFQRASNLKPQSSVALTGLGDALFRQGKVSLALPHLEKAVQLDGRNKKGHYLLGMVYRSLGRQELAQRELSLGLNAGKQYMPDPWTGQVESHGRRMDEAMIHAQALLAAGRAGEAIQLLEGILAWQSDHVYLLNNLASMYMETKQFAKANALLNKALALDDGQFSTFINLANCALRAGQPGTALGYANRAVELAPNIAQTYLARYHIQAALKRSGDALADLRRAFDIDPGNADVTVELAYRLLLSGDAKQAQTYYSEAIRRNPWRVGSYIGLFEASLQAGDFEQARSSIEKVRAMAPGDPNVAKMTERYNRMVPSP